MAEAIKVKITDDLGTTTISTNASGVSGNSTNKPLNPSAKENQKKSTANVVAKTLAMRSISYASSNVGKYTGNSRNQAVVNNIRTGMGYAVAFATNPILGIAVMSMDGITTALDYAYENKWNQIKANQMQIRIGGKGGYRR
jgi:hypothetical protein